MDVTAYILSLLQSAWYIFEVIVIFGILVAGHEYGHFIAAKLTGMRVDEFGIGFGKRLFSWKRGETLYTVNLIPLGGYNRIYGMDVEDPKETEKRKREAAEGDVTPSEGPKNVPPDYSAAPPDDPQAFINRPLFHRFLVVISGPIANILIAVLVVFLMGVFVGFPAAEIGDVVPGGPAHGQGLRKGDIITHLNGVRISSTADLRHALAFSGGRALYLTGVRDSTEFKATIIPQTIRLSDSHFCRIGFVFLNDGTIIHVPPDSPAERAGVRGGDVIIRADGIPFPSHQLDLDSGNGVFVLEIYRDYRVKKLEIEYFDNEFNRDTYNPFGFFYNDEGVVVAVIRNDIAYDAGLEVGDIIVEPENEPSDNAVEGVTAVASGAEYLHYERSGKVHRIRLEPDMSIGRIQVYMDDAAESLLVGLPYNHRLYQAGFRSGDEILSVDGVPTPNGISAFLEFERHLGSGVTVVAMSGVEERVVVVPLPPDTDRDEVQAFFGGLHFKTRYYRTDLKNSFIAGVRKSHEIAGFIFKVLGMLATGKASVRDLYGPVGIVTITYQAASSGLVDLINIMVLISVNLAIFNLLPFPALDGGRILFMIPEAIFRRPIITVKIENIIHIAGFLLLVLFALFVTYQDIYRIFFSN